MEILILGVLSVLAIVLASQASTKMRVASPLILVVVGIGVSLLPIVPDLRVEPEIILAGVLPPLLYSAAVSMPTMDFRRDFRAISGLSVILVVFSSVAIGLLFFWLIPGLGLAAGIALGAIISPTDAVATTIVKRLGVSPRVTAVLEGESLLNDATALVLLRSAIVAFTASISFWSVLGQFAYSVAVAVVIGLVVGWLNLRLRSRVKDAAVNTAISFTIPFIASIPAEALGASGLVAAVTAGLITGRGAAKWLTPAHRFSDAQNWRTVELLLEGAVFLVMGLELSAILADLESGSSVGLAALLAVLALVVTVIVRTAYVAPLLWGLSRSARESDRRREQLPAMQERLDKWENGELDAPAIESRRGQRPLGGRARPGDAERFRDRAVRYVADVEYMQAEPLGVREGGLVVWAGMRGVVTLAAAQTLPEDTPLRSLLVLIAFFVAAFSLLLQGGTLGAVARWLGLTGIGANIEERDRLSRELGTAAMAVLEEQGIDRTMLFGRRDGAASAAPAVPPAAGSADASAPGDESELAEISDDEGVVPDPSPDREKFRAIRVLMIEAQRGKLLELQKQGTYSSGALTWALETLDADQISIDLRSPDAI